MSNCLVTAALVDHCGENASQFCDYRLYTNFFIIAMTGYVVCVLIVVTRPEWIRLPLPSELPHTVVPISANSISPVDSHHAGKTANHEFGRTGTQLANAWSTPEDRVHQRRVDPANGSVGALVVAPTSTLNDGTHRSRDRSRTGTGSARLDNAWHTSELDA